MSGPSTAIGDPSTAPAACPHIVFRDVFGRSMVADLLNYVCTRQTEFRPSLVRSRLGTRRADYDLRSSVSLADFGPFKAPFEAHLRGISGDALRRLDLSEPRVKPESFEILAYQDGGRFGAHIDTHGETAQVRILSCVYYFAVTPRRFSGGQLRLYGFPTLSAAGSPPTVEIVPETDKLVIFPSWLRHEVLPVHVPSGAWEDSRFTLNC